MSVLTAPHVYSDHRSEKGIGSLALDLWMVVNHHNGSATELKSSARTTALNH